MAHRTASIRWLGHSTFHVTSAAGTKVLFEAWVDSNPACPDDWKRLDEVDLVLVSHGHGDHVQDVAAIQQRSGALVAGAFDLMPWVIEQGVPEDRFVDFGKGGTIELAGVQFTMVDAKHGSSTPDGRYAGEPAGFVVEFEDGYCVYHAGDTCVFSDMALIGELYQPDIALLPIGGHYTMDPRQAAKAVELLGVREVLGMHYATFPPLAGRPADLRARVDDDVTVHELAPGESLQLSAAVAV
jgi:L-ascorbate metabolism protein UlaG (beta-lactamase superfamily)